MSDTVKKLKKILEEETSKKNDVTELFSQDVINLAYQKLSANTQDLIGQNEDPMMIAEILKNYLEVEKMINERGLSKQHFLVKAFEALNKYEKSRYS